MALQKTKKLIRSYVPFYRRNLAIAIPVMLSQLGQAMVMLADTMMVGRIGTNELAAVSFANAVFLVGFVLAQGIAFGSTPVIGPNYATGNYRKAGLLFQHSIVVDATAAIAIGGGMYALSHFMDRMGQEEAVWKLAVPYYRTLVISLFPYLIFLAFKQFMEGLGNTKYAMQITILTALLNILLNWIFIFGKCGCPAMGVLGAGIATLISRCCMPILYLALFRKRPSIWRYFRFFGKRLNWKDVSRLSSIGLPIGLQMFIECSCFSLSAIMAGWFGSTSLASHEIAMNISSLTFMVVTGIASGTTIRVSHQLGQQHYTDMRKAGIASMHLSICYNLICALLMLTFRHQIPLAYTSDANVIGLSATLLIFAALYQIADGLQSVTLGALRGMSDVHLPMVIATTGYVCINLPISYLLGVKAHWGIYGIWTGFIIGLYAVAGMAIIRYLTKTRQIIRGAAAN